MAKLATPAVIMLKDCQLTIGQPGASAVAGTDDDFAAHASAVTFTPSGGTPAVWQGLTPDSSVTEVADVSWSCVLAYGQDWTSTKSLSRFLHTNAGATVPVVFQPKAGTGLPTVSARLTLVPGPIGGTKNQQMAGSVTCGVVGKPTLGVAS